MNIDKCLDDYINGKKNYTDEELLVFIKLKRQISCPTIRALNLVLKNEDDNYIQAIVLDAIVKVKQYLLNKNDVKPDKNKQG